MKTSVIRYSCETIKDNVYLRVQGYYVGKYSLTLTAEECIEDLCDQLGWCLIAINEDQHSMLNSTNGIINIQRPDYPPLSRQLARVWEN